MVARANLSVGQAPDVPEQVSATSQTPAFARHMVAGDTNPSAGQAKLEPSHASATSQIPALGRHTRAAETAVQVPSALPPAATEQAWQSFGLPPPQALAQHTPSTQLPVPHWLAVVQAPPTLASTVTLKVASLWLPWASVAVHVTVVLPTGNKLPVAGTHTGVMGPST